MPRSVGSMLRELSRQKSEYGDAARQRKMELLRLLQRRRLPRAADVLQLHEALCFLRAYPDDGTLLAQVESMLQGFAQRGDLRRHRRALRNSGLAGTETQFAFYAATATWLARRWGAYLSVLWDELQHPERLEAMLPELALHCETLGLDEYGFELREWIETLKGPRERDAEFILRRLEQWRVGPSVRDALVDDMDIPLRLSPGQDTPSRTHETYAAAARLSHMGAPDRSRPSLPGDAARPLQSVRHLGPAEGAKLVDLARAAMVSRHRDLDAFAYGDKNDVRLVAYGNGVLLAYIGVIPERRLMLETLYGFLMLKNGVVVGYGVNSCLFNSAEIAYTVFDTFRLGESARMYGHVVASAKQLFGSDTIMVDPYQIGEDNEDAIRSGAWWFYYKLGFRPRDPRTRGVMRRELRRIKAKRAHRSSAATLRQLATAPVFLQLGKAREDVLGVLPLGNIGLQVTRYLAEHFGHDRRRATRVCSQQAADLLGVRSLRGFTRGERLAWQRWSPLVVILPGIQRWSREHKRELVSLVRAKGGRRESEYLLRFDRHRPLRRALRTLAQKE